MNLRITFLDSASIFHILGAVIGINLVLKNIDNPYYWFATGWNQRLIRGLIGFFFNTIFLSFLSKIFFNFFKGFVTFENLTSDYFIFGFFYGISGVICYGYLPLLFSKMNLTNNEYISKKTELLRRKNSDDLIYNSRKSSKLKQSN